MSFRGGRGRGRGRGGGGRGRQAKAVQFELFPEIQDLGTATDVSAPERLLLLKWTFFLQRYCETSPYKYTDGREISKAAEVIKSDIERYSDRVSLAKPKPTFEDVIKIDRGYMPAELVGGDKGKRGVKRVRWNPDKAFEKLDRYEKLEQKLKGKEGKEDEEEEEVEVEEEENVEDGELSNDDYEQIEHFDDDEDDFNDSGGDDNDEGTY